MDFPSVTDLQHRVAAHFRRLRPETLRTASPGKLIKYPYAVPAGFYDQLWDWDGFFINNHLAARPDNPRPEYHRYWVLNFVGAYQQLGYAPGCLSPDGPEQGHRGFTLKPFLAQSALAASEPNNDFEWIREWFPTIVQLVDRRRSDRRDRATGLFWWDSAMASGADNNAADGNHETKGLCLSCDLNAFQYREYHSLAQIARALGDVNAAEQFQSLAQQIQSSVERWLWNDRLGCYDNRRRDTGQFVNCVGYSSFVPLWAGMVDATRASRSVHEHLLQPHMMTQWGGRSLSSDDPHYHNQNIITPYSNWRGPVWPIANWFYFVGLKNYGFNREASELAMRLVRLLLTDLDTIGSMHENYCAETGLPLAPSASHGPRLEEGGFIGWNLLVQDMLEQSLDSKQPP